MSDGGRLVVVGTPLGNLDDLSTRAVGALREASVIACEDTRRTGRLLAAIGVDARELLVVNEHTEHDVAPRIVDRVRRGDVVALVSDAGMPGVSDPGALLVRAVVDADGDVSVVPGPSAASTAVAGSGIPAARWVFEGFLPRKGAERTRRLHGIATEERAVVLYEAPHRVARTLEDLVALGDETRPVAIGRELTKLHEEWFRGTVADAVAWIDAQEPRGEFVFVLGGAVPAGEPTDAELRRALHVALDRGDSTRDAVAAVSQSFGVAKRRVYELALGR